jgi:hypothetical protein
MVPLPVPVHLRSLALRMSPLGPQPILEVTMPVQMTVDKARRTVDVALGAHRAGDPRSRRRHRYARLVLGRRDPGKRRRRRRVPHPCSRRRRRRHRDGRRLGTRGRGRGFGTNSVAFPHLTAPSRRCRVVHVVERTQGGPLGFVRASGVSQGAVFVSHVFETRQLDRSYAPVVQFAAACIRPAQKGQDSVLGGLARGENGMQAG